MFSPQNCNILRNSEQTGSFNVQMVLRILWMAPSSTSLVYFQEKIRRNYLRSGFVIDVLACLPYDALNIFDKDKVFGNADGSGTGYGNIFSILKVRPIKSKQLGAMIWCTYLGHKVLKIWVWPSGCSSLVFLVSINVLLPFRVHKIVT